MKLTDKLIKGLPAPERGNRIVYDDGVKGFGVRVTAAGAKSFVLTYWSAGRQRRYTIGRYPDWPLATARAEAKKLKLELRANGSDPLARLEAERSAPTMADLCQRYLEEHASKKRPSSQADDAGMIRAFVLPAFGPQEGRRDHLLRLRRAPPQDLPPRHEAPGESGHRPAVEGVQSQHPLGLAPRQSVQGHRAQS